MNGEIVIIGMGMITPLGLNVEQSAASIRAGLSAFEETPIMDRAFSPFVLATLPDDTLPELHPDLAKERSLTYREARLLRLAKPAIEQATESIGDYDGTIPLYLGLPEIETRIEMDVPELLERLSKQCEGCFDVGKSRGYLLGRASGLRAVHEAGLALRDGSERVVLAGGVDTFCDLYVLGTLDIEKRVNSEVNMDGFTPGEGAAFLLLTTEENARERGYEIAGLLLRSAVGEEPGHIHSEEPYRGDGLAATITEALSDNGFLERRIPTVFSSMNGENYFAKEWGVSYIRNSDRIENEFRIEHPADCIGDTGAACGPVMIGLALTGIRNGHFEGPALVYASSDGASRAACVVAING